MGPCKFDDISKKAADVLNEDHHTSGYQFKAKQKTSWDNSVVTTTADLFGKDIIKTPSKLSLKLPKPLGLSGIAVDKLEMDKGGGFKFEMSVDSTMHQVPDLKIELKSDLVNAQKATLGGVWGLHKDAMVKFETKPLSPADFNIEVTGKVGADITVGAKCGMQTLTKPQLGANFSSGQIFAALAVKDMSVFSAHGFFKVNDDMNLAATGTFAGKLAAIHAGLHYRIAQGTSVKVKAGQEKGDSVASLTLKHELAKGVTILGGGKFSANSGLESFGVQVSIE